MNKRIIFLLASTLIFLSVIIITRPADSAFAAMKAKVNVNSLNVREKPTVESKKLGQLNKGKEVTISQEKTGWTKILFNQSYGWVLSKYLSKTQAEKVSVKEGYVTASSLNLRKSASTSSITMASLKKGELVQIKSTSGNWLEVYVPAYKKTGWVSKSYISLEKSIPSTPTTVKRTKYYVTANSLNIRKEPKITSEKVFTAKKDEELLVSEVKGNWGKVTTASGKTGWASLSYLTVNAPTTQPGNIPATGLKNKVIVVDAGHGGSDPGASGVNNQEKTLTLNVAKELKRLLEGAGTKVIMTRDGDTYPTLTERVNESHTNNADIFISIHFNSNPNKQANGIDTYYYGTNVNERELANCIQEEVTKATSLKNRGVYEGNFQVIRTNKNDAVLVELGFISNPEEEKIIASKDFQIKAATGIVKGIEKYFNN